MEIDAPKIKFRVERDQVGKVLSRILSVHAVDDIVVEDPPLEEVISNVFSEGRKRSSRPEPNRDPGLIVTLDIDRLSGRSIRILFRGSICTQKR